MAIHESILAKRGAEFKRLVDQEKLILGVTEELATALDERGVSRAELARRLGRTPGFVTQVLGGGRNLTLRTIADFARALDMRPAFRLSGRYSIPIQCESWSERVSPIGPKVDFFPLDPLSVVAERGTAAA